LLPLHRRQIEVPHVVEQGTRYGFIAASYDP
jgi:hypothetical protein